VLDHGEVVAAGPPAKLKVSIGGERLDVVVRDIEQFADAARAVEAAIGRPPELTLDERRLTAPVADGTGALVASVRALDAAGVVVEDIALRHPTLDEVFLALT
jgi:ABC-2 type transport system ATP-binding protein